MDRLQILLTAAVIIGIAGVSIYFFSETTQAISKEKSLQIVKDTDSYREFASNNSPVIRSFKVNSTIFEQFENKGKIVGERLYYVERTLSFSNFSHTPSFIVVVSGEKRKKGYFYQVSFKGEVLDSISFKELKKNEEYELDTPDICEKVDIRITKAIYPRPKNVVVIAVRNTGEVKTKKIIYRIMKNLEVGRAGEIRGLEPGEETKIEKRYPLPDYVIAQTERCPLKREKRYISEMPERELEK
ncbi:MAG: hypothetical protein MUP58_02995 [Candidatus Nanohaloarchaeota archaeon QJJ-9]|nr:hypothetical protein [Candidatus Nanohaloarchaeota archaeon QJJ-9]